MIFEIPNRVEIELIGQIGPDNAINTVKWNSVRQCKSDMRPAFVLNGKYYAFENNKLFKVYNYTEVVSKQTQYDKNADHHSTPNYETHFEERMDEPIENLHVIILKKDLMESPYEDFVTGFAFTDKYNITEEFSRVDSYEEMINDYSAGVEAEALSNMNNTFADGDNSANADIGNIFDEVGGVDDEFRFNDASTHEGHLRQNGKLTWFCNETAIKISHICIRSKTRMNSKIKAVILC